MKRANGPVPFIVHFIDNRGEWRAERVVSTTPDKAKAEISAAFASPVFLKVKRDRSGEGR